MCENEMLGGEGVIVEIDESKFGKRKYNKGKWVEGKWVFGGVERVSDKCFMVVVPDRKKETLLIIIKCNIKPGTTIISDFWRSYDCLEDEGFVHLKVNHSITFKDTTSGAHTNSIEGTWGAIKRQLNTNHVKDQFDKYLFEYMWRRKHQKQKDHLFKIFLQAIIKVYSPITEDQ